MRILASWLTKVLALQHTWHSTDSSGWHLSVTLAKNDDTRCAPWPIACIWAEIHRQFSIPFGIRYSTISTGDGAFMLVTVWYARSEAWTMMKVYMYGSEPLSRHGLPCNGLNHVRSAVLENSSFTVLHCILRLVGTEYRNSLI